MPNGIVHGSKLGFKVFDYFEIAFTHFEPATLNLEQL